MFTNSSISSSSSTFNSSVSNFCFDWSYNNDIHEHRFKTRYIYITI
jgi:hypothetical protein